MNSQQSVIGKPGASGTLDEVSSTRDPIDAVREPSAADRTVLLVGGVPGAGKSTAIGLATAGRTDVDVVDSDTVRRWLRSRLPERLPYRRFRWLVHTLTALWTIGVLVRGPRPNRRLLVHDPSTRSRRRELFARLARFRGWEPVLLLVEATRADAQQGQRNRRRVVRSAAFDRHWVRWLDLRRELVDAPGDLDGGRWSGVHLVDRAQAATALAALLVPPAPTTRAARSFKARAGGVPDQLDPFERPAVVATRPQP